MRLKDPAKSPGSKLGYRYINDTVSATVAVDQLVADMRTREDWDDSITPLVSDFYEVLCVHGSAEQWAIIDDALIARV